MTNEEFEEYLPKFTRSINAIARKIAGANEVLYDDLVQVGRVSLWKFDLARVNKNLVGCINRHLRNRMIDYVRAENGRKHVVTLDDDTHRPRIDTLYLDGAGLIVEGRLDRWEDDAYANLYDSDQPGRD